MIVVAGIAAMVLWAGRVSVVRADALETHDSLVQPRDEVGYRKGRKLRLEVVSIGWAEVEVRTARAFLAMQAAAKADGIELGIRSGFRSMEQQMWLYAAWKAGYGNKAARPGHSNHQDGKALDLYLDTPETFAWLERHARRFGFKRTVRGEPWHWEYVKKLARKKSRRKPR